MRGRHGQYPVQSREAVRILSARFDAVRAYPNVEIDGLGAAAPRARHRVYRVPACTLGVPKCLSCKSWLSVPENGVIGNSQRPSWLEGEFTENPTFQAIRASREDFAACLASCKIAS